MWEMLNLSKLIFCVVLGVQMCIFCCRVQFSSHPPGGPGSALQQSHVFFTSLLILSASLPLMFSTPALYRKEQSAGQHWLLEHVALFMSLLEKRFRWRTASAWPEFYLIQSRLSPNLFLQKLLSSTSSDLIQVDIQHMSPRFMLLKLLCGVRLRLALASPKIVSFTSLTFPALYIKRPPFFFILHRAWAKPGFW